MLHVGKRLAHLLKEYGVTHVFGVPGGQTLPLYEGIMETDGIAHVLMRDERSAGFAADAYARLTGLTGVCDATVGPGATNLPSAIAEAYSSSVPLGAIIADLPRHWEHRRVRGSASQGVRQVEIFSSISKWQATVADPAALDDLADAAFRIANAGRPGPVVLSIPDDVFAAPAPDRPRPARPPLRTPWYRTAPDPALVRDAAAAIARADRPALFVGGGAMLSAAAAEVQALAEYLNVPIATTISGKGVVAETHPLAVGVAGAMGRPIANEVLKDADLIVLVGTKTGQVATFNWRLPAPGVRTVHIDVDAEEIGRNFPDSLPLVGDARLAIAALHAALTHLGVPPKGWDGAAIQARVRRWYAQAVDRPQVDGEPLKPQLVMDLLNQHARPDDMVVCDASLASGWVAAYYNLPAPGRSYLAPRGLAGLGWGAPAAIGAATAREVLGRPGAVLHVAGDGGFAYSVQELEVMARLRLPVITVLLNNSALAWIKHAEKARFGERYISTDFTRVDFAAVARGFGVPAWTARTAAELHAALDQARLAEGPALVDVITDQWETPLLRFSSSSQQLARAAGEGR